MPSLSRRSNRLRLRNFLLASTAYGTALAPVVIPPGETGPFTQTVTLVGQSASPGRVREAAYFFHRGDVGPTEGLRGDMADGTDIVMQVDPWTYHDDGSIAFAGVTFTDPGLANTQEEVVTLTKIASQNKTRLNVNAFAAHTATLRIVAAGQTWDLNIPLTPTSDVWRDGIHTVNYRTQSVIPQDKFDGSNLGRVVVDTGLRSDNTVRFRANIRHDLGMVMPSKQGSTSVRSAPVAYTVKLLYDGVEKYTKDVANHHWGTWFPFEILLNIDGTPALKACEWYLDNAYLFYTGILPYYEPNGYFTSALPPGNSGIIRDQYINLMAGVNYNTPFNLRGIAAYMPTSGGRADVGQVPGPSAMLLMGDKNLQFRQYIRDRSDALYASPWHMWVQAQGQWLNQLDNPNKWFDGRDATVFPVPAGTEITTDLAHPPDDHTTPLLYDGDRDRMDALHACGHYFYMAHTPFATVSGRGSTTNSALTADGKAARIVELDTGTGAGFRFAQGSIGRQAGWTTRFIVRAMMLVPSSMQPCPNYFRRMIAAMLRHYNAEKVQWIIDSGELSGIILSEANIRSANGTYPTWQENYGNPSWIAAALFKVAGAEEFLNFKLNFMIDRFNYNSIWPIPSAIGFFLSLAYPTSGLAGAVAAQEAAGNFGPAPKVLNTRAAAGIAQANWPSSNWGVDYANVTNVGGDYVRLQVMTSRFLLHPDLNLTKKQRNDVRTLLQYLTTTQTVKALMHDNARRVDPHTNSQIPDLTLEP